MVAMGCPHHTVSMGLFVLAIFGLHLPCTFKILFLCFGAKTASNALYAQQGLSATRRQDVEVRGLKSCNPPL